MNTQSITLLALKMALVVGLYVAVLAMGILVARFMGNRSNDCMAHRNNSGAD
jgi:hypothetical protein